MKKIVWATAVISVLLFSGCGGGGGSSTTLTKPLEKKIVTYTSSGVSKSLPMLVVRLEYSDITFDNGATTWHNKLFGNELHELNHYYREVSSGTFAFSPVPESLLDSDGVVTVTLNDREHPDSGADSTIHPDLKEAVIQAGNSVDFNDYDANGDGNITPDELLIVFIVAGYEQAYDSTLSPGVWGHQSCVSSANTPVVDSVGLMGCAFGGNYALFGELHGDHDATVGIIAHELGHAAFRLLDLYDTDESSAGIGFFGLMGAGSWAQADITEDPGETPVHMCAWSKLHNGWLTPSTENNATYETVALSETASPDYNVVKIAINADEYFLLENRNDSGYDQGLYDLEGTFNGGLAIWHVDESVIDKKAASNTVNNDENRKGVDLEEAAMAYLDSNNDYRGHEKNLYYDGNVATFSPFTDPDSGSYASGETGITVNNISARGTVMYADITYPE